MVSWRSEQCIANKIFLVFYIYKRKDVKMIQPINFTGRVYYMGDTQSYSKHDEMECMQRFANRNDCDIAVLNRSYYIDGTGTYDTIMTKVDPTTGTNMLYAKTFDFMHPKKEKEKAIWFNEIV